jgi:hypothetical protein
MHVLHACVIAICCQINDGAATEPSKDEWNHVVLWKSDILSGRLLFKPIASLADQTWIVLELENHTQQPIELGQTWVSTRPVVNEDGTPKSECALGLSGTMSSITKVPPGRHRYHGNSLQYASADVHCPDKEGRVDVLVKISTQTRDGRSFETANDTTFFFEWRQPTETQLAAMSDELKKRMRAKEIPFDDHARIVTLLKVPVVVQSLSVDDYLSALKATDHWALRYAFLPHLFAKHAEDPKVVEYYREMFQKNPDFIYNDSIIPVVWNDEFLEPLVRGCEQGKWHYFMGLQQHVPVWRTNEQVVSRISVALLKHHVILRREVKDIPDEELPRWARAVQDAGNVPDLAILKLLRPALDDQRAANIDLGSGGIHEVRVCDRALVAILTILDGDWWAAFKAAGIQGWKTKDERELAYDRVIKNLKTRLESEAPSIKK